ncbi:transglutaminase family protein [Rhodovulum sulfidophilum]|uniref:transglutaminase family protein n=1 Tax=Rhodovulum sulfidophilum TaxID=35806 RepID=UPI000951A07F|nr:transglutaminase family protein [Rhodovulum sulfidophilum]MBL3553121.1 transglutaminase family protein [Rhodovulum sulfidophilum]MCE8438506.1 transglutaminase family protein [Rhodovulum sulfidophilum]MCE8468499.1 transglutaminase family protein [Rhodovulum sulfidophilum]OLS48879.1 transglutaminase [Rhodovulum sulfidophilum]
MRLKIRHSTRYAFDDPVIYGLQQLRKTPKNGPEQRVIAWKTIVEGGRKELSFEDHHRNTVELISFERDVTELVVRSEGEVEVLDTSGVIGPHRGPSPLWLFRQPTVRTRAGPGCRALLREVKGESDLDRLHALLRVVHGAVGYEIGVSRPDWTAEEALAAGKGVCQDHAHVFVACAREMGFPARYVSGYLMTDGVQYEASHAWAEAHVEGLGWVGFDVSNEMSPDGRYVRVATGLDYAEAAPVTGSRMGGSGEALSVEIEVAQQ